MIFSWSLASNERGLPVIIMRAYKNIDREKGVEIKIKSMKNKIKIKYHGCDEKICISYLRLNKLIIKSIKDKEIVDVTLNYDDRSNTTLSLPLEGLLEALNKT